MHSSMFISFSVVYLLFAGAHPASAQQSKTDGEIRAHRAEKTRLGALPAAARAAEAVRLGLNSARLDAEEVALYVKAQLSPKEMDELVAQGIAITRWLWVPPVAGKHPYGFHLATVPYDRLPVLENDARVVRLESAEYMFEPNNDVGGALINVDDVHDGNGVPSRDGTGVNIAVADTGVDLTHADFPTPLEAYDMTDGTGPGTWGTNVANTVSGHGTHVSGTVLGSGGLSGGQYVGGAPGANFHFYKIANDINGTASATDIIEAINRALAVGCHVFSMSFGGTGTYMDGSSAMPQAVDAAVAAGMTVFLSAGNEGNDAAHDSLSVAPGASSPSFDYTIVNPSGGSPYTSDEWIRVIWIDDVPGDGNMSLACTNLGGGESLVQAFSGTSPRNTDAKRYVLTPNIGAGGSKTYNFVLSNSAGAGDTPLVHLYSVVGFGTFDSADPNYTVSVPALADSAIAVAAWVHRASWVDYFGSGWTFGQTAGGVATFSSRGPRIDGLLKPDIAAPGSATISTRDSVPGLHSTTELIVDNDGLNLNGSGPADYYVLQGTSMAAPMAAGAAGLLIEANPGWGPADVRSALTSTASQSGSPDTDAGYGLIDVLAAIQSSPTGACCVGTSCTDDLDEPTCTGMGGTSRIGQTCASVFCACVNGSGDCGAAHGGVGCDDEACCSAVCSASANCCTVGWDGACVSAAESTCALNDDCGDARTVGLGVTPFDTTLATTDGAADCLGGDTNVGTNDIWFEHQAVCTEDLTVSLCANTNYDSTVQVYTGSSCPPGTQLACGDDDCGVGGGPSEVTVGVTGGQSYLIRVGGWGGASGSGELNLAITCPNSDPVVDAGPDQNADEGATVSLAPATFTDADTGDAHTAEIDWGDGTVEPGTVNESVGSGTVSGSHVYADNGVYQVILTVDDGAGGIGQDALDVGVANVDPTVSAGQDRLVLAGETVELQSIDFSLGGFIVPAVANRSTIADPGFDDASVPSVESFTAVIDWDDGPTEAGVVEYTTGAAGVPSTGTVAGSHVYESGGTYTLTVTVDDDDAGSGADQATITVDDPGPMASLTAIPNAAGCQADIAYDGTSSTHPNPFREIVLYEWDFDYDGIAFAADASGPMAVFAYPTFGQRTAALRVTDDGTPPKSNVATTVIEVDQGNNPPVANHGGPYSVNVGDSVALDAAGSSDPNDGCGDFIKFYAWDWDGDSVFDSSLPTPTLLLGPVELATLPSNTPVTVTLRVTDTFDATDEVATTLTHVVANQPPVVTAVASFAEVEGSAIAVEVATFTDPDASDTHTAVIDWGDNTMAPGVVVEAGGSGTVNGSHVYGDNGVYEVTVTVDDRDLSADDSLTITINNASPVVNAGPDRLVFINEPVLLGSESFDLNGTTIDAVPDRAIFGDAGFDVSSTGTLETFTADVDWADAVAPLGRGGPAPNVEWATGMSGVPSTGTVEDSHTYTLAGVYDVVVTVFDDDAGLGSDSFVVTVLDCIVEEDCDDASVCTRDVCVSNVCQYPPRQFGDVNDDGSVDVFDILCVLDGFAEDFSTCPEENVDLSPCPTGGDGVDVFDILAVLDAFAGNHGCCP